MIHLRLFLSFMVIGWMTYGCGYSALPLVNDLVVDRYAWLAAEEVADIIAISEMSPGPFSLNCASFVGMKVAGIPGALLATLGFILPPMAVTLLLAVLYRRFRTLPVAQKLFSVLNACIIAILLGSAIDLVTSSIFDGSLLGGPVDPLALAVFIVSFLAIFLWKVPPMVVLLGAAAAGVIVYPLIG